MAADGNLACANWVPCKSYCSLCGKFPALRKELSGVFYRLLRGDLCENVYRNTSLGILFPFNEITFMKYSIYLKLDTIGYFYENYALFRGNIGGLPNLFVQKY